MLYFALLQLNLSAGAIARNHEQIKTAVMHSAGQLGSDSQLLCIAPELAICGAPLNTLPQMSPFLELCSKHLHALAAELSEGPALIIGCPEMSKGELLSSLFLINKGAVQRICSRPMEDALSYGLPRIKKAGQAASIDFCGMKLAVALGRTFSTVPDNSNLAILADCEPFEPSLWHSIENSCSEQAKSLGCPVLRANPVGGNGSWIFPGGSLAADSSGNIRLRSKDWKQDIITTNISELTTPSTVCPASKQENCWGDVWQALVLGIQDYVHKSGFERVVLGLSGGMDSSVVAALAADALGSANVFGILMPSPWSSQGSLDDSHALATNLGIATHTVPIKPIMTAFSEALSPLFAGTKPDTTEENLQARIRGCLLMAWSNKFRAMLLSTSNKSEAAVGYGTLYGDMAGSLAPIIDVYKTDIYKLAGWFNAHKRFDAIPRSVFDKAPSAELRPGQKDQDSLPPYDLLDACLKSIFEGSTLPEYVSCTELNESMLQRTAHLVRCSEFKRHQCTQPLFVTARPLALGLRPLPALTVE